MDERKDDNVILLALLVAMLGGTHPADNPYAYDLVQYLRRRARFGESKDPELDTLLEHALYSRRQDRVGDIAHDVADIKRRLSRVSADLYDLTWILEAGGDVQVAKLRRAVPVRIYVGESPSYEVRRRLPQALDELLRSLGFEQVDELPEELGSWWKRFVFKSKSALTHEEVLKRLKKGEEALEATYLDKPQAEANNQQAQGAASVIAALKDVDNACVQVGSLLVVKATDGNGKCVVAARTLTRDELKHFEQNQGILKEPQQVLELLQSAKHNESDH